MPDCKCLCELFLQAACYLSPCILGDLITFRAVQWPENSICNLTFLEWFSWVDAAAGCCILSMAHSPPASVETLRGGWRKHQANTGWRAATVEDALGFVLVNLRCFPLPPKSFPSTLPHDLAKRRVMWLWVNRMRTDLDKDTAGGCCTDNSIVHSLD